MLIAVSKVMFLRSRISLSKSCAFVNLHLVGSASIQDLIGLPSGCRETEANLAPPPARGSHFLHPFPRRVGLGAWQSVSEHADP